jgi:hypothetical protein
LNSQLFKIFLAFFLAFLLSVYVYTQNYILLVSMLIFYLYAIIIAIVGWASLISAVFYGDKEIIDHSKIEKQEKNIDLVFILIGFMWVHNFYLADFLFFSGMLFMIFFISLLVTLFTFLFKITE